VEQDAIYCKDARHMEEVEDASVQLVVTSPPYNVGKAYESPMSLEEYLAFLKEVWRECVRVLCPGGRLAVNVASTGRQPYVPLHAYITTQLVEMGLLMRGEVIWDKGASVGVSTAWGSFAKASNPTLRDVHEYILVFSKESPRLPSRGRESRIANSDFVEWTRSIWRFDTESPKRVGHPAPFPEELPRRLLLLYTNVDDLVLDPFMGSGTTAVAAVKENRHFIGYDASQEYCNTAKARVEEAGKWLDTQVEFA
jgi:DNA modification methylase